MKRSSSRWTIVATGVASIALTVLAVSPAGAGTGKGIAKTEGTLTCCAY